jgi:hypothetical protein
MPGAPRTASGDEPFARGRIPARIQNNRKKRKGAGSLETCAFFCIFLLLPPVPNSAPVLMSIPVEFCALCALGAAGAALSNAQAFSELNLSSAALMSAVRSLEAFRAARSIMPRIAFTLRPLASRIAPSSAPLNSNSSFWAAMSAVSC